MTNSIEKSSDKNQDLHLFLDALNINSNNEKTLFDRINILQTLSWYWIISSNQENEIVNRFWDDFDNALRNFRNFADNSGIDNLVAQLDREIETYFHNFNDLVTQTSQIPSYEVSKKMSLYIDYLSLEWNQNNLSPQYREALLGRIKLAQKKYWEVLSYEDFDNEGVSYKFLSGIDKVMWKLSSWSVHWLEADIYSLVSLDVKERLQEEEYQEEVMRYFTVLKLLREKYQGGAQDRAVNPEFVKAHNAIDSISEILYNTNMSVSDQKIALDKIENNLSWTTSRNSLNGDAYEQFLNTVESTREERWQSFETSFLAAFWDLDKLHADLLESLKEIQSLPDSEDKMAVTWHTLALLYLVEALANDPVKMEILTNFIREIKIEKEWFELIVSRPSFLFRNIPWIEDDVEWWLSLGVAFIQGAISLLYMHTRLWIKSSLWDFFKNSNWNKKLEVTELKEEDLWWKKTLDECDTVPEKKKFLVYKFQQVFSDPIIRQKLQRVYNNPYKKEKFLYRDILKIVTDSEDSRLWSVSKFALSLNSPWQLRGMFGLGVSGAKEHFLLNGSLANASAEGQIKHLLSNMQSFVAANSQLRASYDQSNAPEKRKKALNEETSKILNPSYLRAKNIADFIIEKRSLKLTEQQNIDLVVGIQNAWDNLYHQEQSLFIELNKFTRQLQLRDDMLDADSYTDKIILKIQAIWDNILEKLVFLCNKIPLTWNLSEALIDMSELDEFREVISESEKEVHDNKRAIMWKDQSQIIQYLKQKMWDYTESFSEDISKYNADIHDDIKDGQDILSNPTRKQVLSDISGSSKEKLLSEELSSIKGYQKVLDDVNISDDVRAEIKTILQEAYKGVSDSLDSIDKKFKPHERLAELKEEIPDIKKILREYVSYDNDIKSAIDAEIIRWLQEEEEVGKWIIKQISTKVHHYRDIQNSDLKQGVKKMILDQHIQTNEVKQFIAKAEQALYRLPKIQDPDVRADLETQLIQALRKAGSGILNNIERDITKAANKKQKSTRKKQEQPKRESTQETKQAKPWWHQKLVVEGPDVVSVGQANADTPSYQDISVVHDAEFTVVPDEKNVDNRPLVPLEVADTSLEEWWEKVSEIKNYRILSRSITNWRYIEGVNIDKLKALKDDLKRWKSVPSNIAARLQECWLPDDISLYPSKKDVKNISAKISQMEAYLRSWATGGLSDSDIIDIQFLKDTAENHKDITWSQKLSLAKILLRAN